MGLQLLVLQLFVTAVALTLGAAAVSLLWLGVERVWGLLPPSRRLRRVRAFFLSLGLLGVACIAYGYFVEPYWLEVTHHRIEVAQLKTPLRIAHISDLHCEARPRLENELVERVAAEKPDLIVFTGDALNKPEGLPLFRATMQKLAQVAPAFGVSGNWDSWYWKQLHPLAETGFREVNGDVAELDVRGQQVCIGGVAVENEAEVPAVLEGFAPGALSIFLYHYPDEIEKVRGRADLYCAGHTHGGQVALPFYGALITLSKFGKRFEAGLYREGSTWLYVNRGLGMEGGAAPRVRFCARPEVTILEVHPGVSSR